MNPSEAVLYPASYFRDMAFFVTKSMTHIFSEPNSSQTSNYDLPPTVHKSDIPIIAAAIDGRFASRWECQLYKGILKILQGALLDESVIIGTVVLLDLLGDLYRVGEQVDGKKSKCLLAPYPHEDYIQYFKGAFMLAFRLLCQNRPMKSGYWERVMREGDMDVETETVIKIEIHFRQMLEEHINYYTPLSISEEDRAYQSFYTGDPVVPPNAFIPRLRYLRTKSTMYAHIRVLMTCRGQVPDIHSRLKARKRDLALHLAPCHEHMMEMFICLENIRALEPSLRRASNKRVYRYIESQKRAQSKPLVGLGLRSVYY